MSKIRGKDLIKLGFERNDEDISRYNTKPYHYYTWNNGDGTFLISDASDERVKGKGYSIEFFTGDNFVFDDLKSLKQLMKILKKASK